ncbi:MAG: hypothetical protein EBX41_01730 [Chitinophagia bacterium]|nr:hypothetical protein [Chitinophagia bacterium]
MSAYFMAHITHISILFSFITVFQFYFSTFVGLYYITDSSSIKNNNEGILYFHMFIVFEQRCSMGAR